MATETQIPEFVCLKSCETEDNAWSSELPGNKVKQLETVNTEVETGKLTNESGTFLQALSDPMVNAGQHSKIPESCEATTTIQGQEEEEKTKSFTEAVSTQTEAGKEETIENEEKNDEKVTDRNGVTRSQDAVFEDIIKETTDGQDAATEFLKEETEDKVIDAQKASEECEIGAKEKEEEKPEEIEQEEETAEIRPSVEIEEKLDEKEEKTDSPLIKEVTVSEKAENQQEVNMLEKEQGEKDATFAQDVTLEKADNEEVKTKESSNDETEEIGNIIEKPEQINVIPTDVYISTQAQATTEKEDAEDKSIDAQEASKQYEDGTNNNGEQKPEENVDKIVESCLKLEQDEYTEEIKPTVEKNEESQVKTAELVEEVNSSQKENLSIKEVSEERNPKTESLTQGELHDDEHVEDSTFEDVKETLDGQDATKVADCKEQDLNEEPREFLLEESEVKLTHVQQASEECENEANEKGEEKPKDSVKKREKEEEFRPIVEETGLEKAENHEIVSKNEDEKKEQEQDVNAVTEEIIGEEAKVDAENQADKTQDKIEMKDEVISTEKASEECETGAKEKEEEKAEETVEKIEQEEEIAEIGQTVEVEEKLDEKEEKSDSHLVKEVTEETVSEVVILEKDDEDQEKEQEVNTLGKEQGEKDTTLEKGLQDHSEDNEQEVVTTKESIEEETEEIGNIIEKPEQINEEPIQETTENEEAEDKPIDAQEASEQYEDGTNNKGEQEPVDKIVDSCLKLEQQEIKPTVEETQVKTAELEEEVNGSQKENLSIREISEERNTKTESFTEAKSNDDEDAIAGQDATIVADFKEQDLNAESREFLLEETEDKLTDVQEASEECENEAKDSVKKSEKEEEIPEIRPIVEESGSEKAENQEVVNMLEKDEDEEKEQEVNILEKDQDVIPTDICISTQSELKEETTEIEEKNDEEVIDGQTNKSEIPLVKELCEKELNENEIVSKNEDEEKEQNGVISSPNASNEDISIDAPEITEQYEDEANNKEEEEIGINKIVDSCSKVEQEEYTEELKPSVEESTELVEETIESAGGQKENPSIKEETESENIKSETVDISDNLSKDKDEEKEQELNMSEQNQEEDNVTCSEIKEEAIEIGEKNDDNQEQSEIPLVKETTTSEKVEFEQVTEQSDSFATELESNEIVKKEENLEKEQEQDVNTVTEELTKDKLVDAQEMSSELQQPKQENIEEIQACLTETISGKTEDEITETGQDLSHEDTNDNKTEEKMVVDGRTREIEISTLEHEPVEEQKCDQDEVSKENLTDLNETIAVQEDITVSNSLETSTEDTPIDDFTSVSQVQIPQVVPTSEECVTADTTVHVDEEKETTKEEISRDDNVLTELKEEVNVPENLLIKDVSEEIESKSERVELSDSLTKDKDVPENLSIEDLQTKNDDTRENVDEDTEEEIKSVVEIEEDAETKPSEEITEIAEENDGGQKKSETSSEKAEFQQVTEHSDSLGMELDKNKIVSKEQEQNVNVTSDEKDKSEQKPDDTVNEPVNSCPEIIEEYIKEDEADAENQADKTDEKVEMKDEVIFAEKVSLELEQENVIEGVTKIEDTNDNTKEEEKIFETREIEISTLDHESVSKENLTDLNETAAVEPQEDITLSDSLESSEKVKTESEIDDVESVSEVVPTSGESNMKEECLISETTVRVDEEKETESDEKPEIKQETSLEKAESEGLELSDSSNVEQQGLLNVITSSAPTESKEETTKNEEKSEDIDNDGQTNKAKIPLAEQVCEVTSLEEDRSIDAQECENGANDKTEQIPKESVVEENIIENEADEGDNKEIKAKLDADNQADRTQDTSDIKDDVISAQKMSSELERPDEENVIGDRILYVTKLEEEEEKISTLAHEPETTAAEPQEDITVSDSLEPSTKDTFSSEKVRTESESLPIDDVESVEVVPTSDESNLKEDISETTGRVIEEKETVTESDEKTEIKQETSLEKAELEGLKLSDVDQQGLLDVITSSEPTESKEEKSEDIENDGQIKKAEIPLVEQVCEVTSLEVEDRSVEIPEESVEENIKENEADAGDKTQDTSEMKDEVISMSAELEQPKEENVEAEIITEKTEDTITKNDDQEKIEDTNDNNTTEEEKIVLDEKTTEFEISEHVEEQNCFDQVSKENFTDLNETAAVENTSNSDKEKTETESLSTNDLETVSEVQIPEVGPVSEESNQKEECLVSATAHVTEHIEKEDTGDHKLDPETEILCPATQETSEPDETETKLDAENQVERTEGITAVKVDEEIHACLTATKSESTEDEITKEDEEKCILDGIAREIEISTIEQEPVEEKNSGVDEVLTETAVETQEDVTVSDSLETSTEDTLDSEKAKTESENSQKDDLEEQIPEVVPALEESKVNKEYLISETATHVDEEKETITLSDETTQIMQETSIGLEEFVKTKESVDEDTKEIKSSVETNETESESPLIKEVCESTSSDNIGPKDSDSFNTKLDENEIVNKTTEATIEILGEETEDKSYDAQEASEDIPNDEIEQKPVENVIEENVKEDAEKKDIEAKLDDKTEDRSEMKDEVVTTEKIEDEITEKGDNLENAYDNTTKGELEYEPVEEQNADLDEEKLSTLNEKTAVGPTLTKDTSNSDKATAESEHLPINDLESVSEVQIPEIKPKLEDSATTDYHINETLEKSYITTEENMPQVDSACEKINIEEDVTQLKSTDDKSEMVQDVILNEEIAYSHPVAAEVAEVKGKDDHVDEALISPSLEDVATIESQVEKLPTRALESISDVQTPEVIADSADPNEISSAPVKSDEEKNDLDKEDKALTIENLELHDELKPTSELTIEEQVNELKPQQEQSEKNIINGQTLESKLEEKDFEDGKEDIVTLAPEKQNEMMKNVILTNEVVVETENEKGGNEDKEDNSPTELEYTLTTNKKELENEVPNFEFEKKEKDDELISQVQTPESILKTEMKEEATNDTCEMVLLEDEKENISINEEAIHNQLPSDTNEVFQIEKLNSSRNETTEDPKSIAENLKLKDETFTDMKRSDEDSETVAAEVEILENIVTEEKIVKTDANKEKETLDEPHEDEAENLPEASIEKHDPEIKTKSEVAEIVPEDRESCSILTENLPEASKEITTTTEKIEKEIEVSCLSVEKVGEIQVSTLNSEEKQNDSGDMQNKEREVQESSAQNDKKFEDSLVQPSIEKEIIQDVVRNEEIEQPNLDKTFEFVNQETQKEQADEYMIPIEDVKSSTREFEIPAVMEATADKADNTEDLYNKTVEAEKGVINENKSKPTEEVSGIKQEPLELDAPLTLDTTAKEDLKISQKYVTDDLIKTSQTQPEIQKYDVTTSTVDKQSPTEPQENENNLLTNQIDAKPLTAEVEDFKATEPQSEVIKEEKKLSDENKTSESEVVENLIGQRELTLPKDQLVEKEKSGVKSDEENEEEDEDNEKMGSDAPVMVEASKDMEVKVHKKSHNILSGVGSKVKHSIAKVKKAITGGKSSPKSPSPPPKERDQVIT